MRRRSRSLNTMSPTPIRLDIGGNRRCSKPQCPRRSWRRTTGWGRGCAAAGSRWLRSSASTWNFSTGATAASHPAPSTGKHGGISSSRSKRPWRKPRRMVCSPGSTSFGTVGKTWLAIQPTSASGLACWMMPVCWRKVSTAAGINCNKFVATRIRRLSARWSRSIPMPTKSPA